MEENWHCILSLKTLSFQRIGLSGGLSEVRLANDELFQGNPMNK